MKPSRQSLRIEAAQAKTEGEALSAVWTARDNHGAPFGATVARDCWTVLAGMQTMAVRLLVNHRVRATGRRGFTTEIRLERVEVAATEIGRRLMSDPSERRHLAAIKGCTSTVPLFGSGEKESHWYAHGAAQGLCDTGKPVFWAAVAPAAIIAAKSVGNGRYALVLAPATHQALVLMAAESKGGPR